MRRYMHMLKHVCMQCYGSRAKSISIPRVRDNNNNQKGQGKTAAAQADTLFDFRWKLRVFHSGRFMEWDYRSF